MAKGLRKLEAKLTREEIDAQLLAVNNFLLQSK